MYPIYNYPMFTPHNSLKLACLTDILNSADDNDDKMVVTSNVTTPKISKRTHSLLDSGATDHFLAINSHVKNRRPAKNAINVEIPN